MDVGRAFTFVTEDPEWVKKLLLGGVIVLASMLLTLILIGIVGYFLLFGYYIEVIRRVSTGTAVPLPEWDDLGGYIVRGFFGAVGALIWTTPLIIVACVGIIGGSALNDSAGNAFAIGTVCLLLPIFIALSVLILPVVVARYAVTGEFGAMFQFGEIFAEMQRVLVPLLIIWVMSIVVYFIANLGIVACFIGVAFTMHYAYLVHSYLIGDMYRLARGGESVTKTAF